MPRPKVNIYTSALLLSLGSSLSSLQEKPDGRPSYEQSNQSLEKFAAQKMAFGQTPDISVDFIKDDFIWAREFGYADLIRSGKERELRAFAAISKKSGTK